MIESLAPDLLSELAKCGWEKGRSVDHRSLTTYCYERCIPISPRIVEVMASLTDIAFPESKEFSFSIGSAYERLGGRQYLQDLIYETEMGLCPIASGSASIVFMALDGRFVVLNDQWMGYFVVATLADLLAWMMHRPGIKYEEHQLDMG